MDHKENDAFKIQSCRGNAFAVLFPRSLSRSYFTTDGQSDSVSVSSTLVGLATRYYFLSECCCLNLRSYFCETPSLMRGWVCNLQFNQWSESRRTRNHTLLSYQRLPQPGGPGSRIYISQEQGGPVTPPGTGFPLRRLLRLGGLRRK
jgi:hypothetical protein